MQANETKTHEAIRNALAVRYPGFPIVVTESPDDQLVLCVSVFAVPSAVAGQLKSAIRQIGRELFPGGEYLLLPMVKTVEVTRQHYPEFMPPAPTDSLAAVLDRYLLEHVREHWQTATCVAVQAGDCGLLKPQGGFDMEAIIQGQLRPWPLQETAIPANEELALAA